MNQIYPDCWFLDTDLYARIVNRYLMDEYTRPHPTILYVSMAEAADMLAPFYKTANKMSRKQLEQKLNFIAGREMEKRKIALFCYFCVVGNDGAYDEPIFLPRPAYEGDQANDRLDCGLAYQVEQARDEWIRAWRGTY